jgi:hypothetical protein
MGPIVAIDYSTRRKAEEVLLLCIVDLWYHMHNRHLKMVDPANLGFASVNNIENSREPTSRINAGLVQRISYGIRSRAGLLKVGVCSTSTTHNTIKHLYIPYSHLQLPAAIQSTVVLLWIQHRRATVLLY